MAYTYCWLMLLVFSIYFHVNSADEELNDHQKALKYVHNLNVGKIIIDTDSGSDDAVGILLSIQEILKKHNDKQLMAITCVFGNAEVPQVAINVMKSLKTVNRLDEIPVYIGADQGLIIKEPKSYFFGKDGLGDFNFTDPPDLSQVQPEHAVQALIRLVRENPGEITILALGPLTNIALAIRMDPTFRANVKEILIIGGCVSGYGNMWPGVEYNAYIDPEAYFIVLNSTHVDTNPVILLPWDTLLEYTIPIEWRQNTLGTYNNSIVNFLNKAERVFNTTEDVWWASDSMLAYIAFDPTVVINVETYYMSAVLQGEMRGGFLTDKTHILKRHNNAIVVTQYNLESYQQAILQDFK